MWTKIRDLIAQLKHTEKEKVNYMTFQMRIDEEREEAWKEGHAAGEASGEARGESRLSSLISLLLKNGKTDEIAAATENENVRQQLYAKYGIA